MLLRNYIYYTFAVIAFSLLGANNLLAQNGANFKAGLVLVGDINTGSLSDTAFHRKGFHVGIDARIGPYGFYLSPGLHYYNFDIATSNNYSFFSQSPKFHVIKGPLNLAYKIFITRKLKFRVKGGASINYILLIDKNPYNVNFDTVNDAYFGINAGIGMDISRLTFDLNYESGLTPAFNDTHKTKFNYLSASLGFFF